MIDSGPHYEPDLFVIPFRLGRLHKGGSGAAIAEQRLAREQSAKQFAEQMGLAREQQEAAKNIRTPQYLPAEASRNPEDSYYAARDVRRAAKRRFGSAATVLSPTPYRPALGGAVPLAA